MNSYRIVLLPGDGIGPEVLSAARQVLETVANRDFSLEFVSAAIGGHAIDEHGTALPSTTIETCEQADAMLLGAVGGPKWSDPSATIRPEQGLLALRSHFELFANLRPILVFPALIGHAPLRPELLENVDLLFVRELTGGLYFGQRQEQGDGDHAWDRMEYSEYEVERVARVAFEAARKRRGKVTSIDKANVLASMRLWRRTVDRVSTDYPDVQVEHRLVDACAMQILMSPADFDVLLTGNLFGDILSDEASVLAGSLGLLPSASLGAGKLGIYEPIHGSAPDIAGRGIANPLGAILSAALLLRHSLGQAGVAQQIEQAVADALAAGHRTVDLCTEGGLSTDEMTDRVIEHLPSSVNG